MKRAALIGFVMCGGLAAGCSRRPSDQLQPPQGHEKRSAAVAVAPEDAISKLETAEDRATYLHQLKHDSTFEPQKHAEMLQKYAGDPDQEVASAAKDLLDGIK